MLLFEQKYTIDVHKLAVFFAGRKGQVCMYGSSKEFRSGCTHLCWCKSKLLKINALSEHVNVLCHHKHMLLGDWITHRWVGLGIKESVAATHGPIIGQSYQQAAI